MTSDETLGGYVATHQCPPAFSGSDDLSYSAEVYVDDEPQEDGRFGAAVYFIRWSANRPQPTGHLETCYLAYGDSPDAARSQIENLTLFDLKKHLDSLIEKTKE